jgi:hypothetical protein
MKIKRVEVLVPAGKYAIGDPCYAVANDDWDGLLKSCNYFQNPIGYVEDGVQAFPVLAFSTKWGDGSYRGTDGKVYDVDAGLIGLVPVEIITDFADCEFITFDKDTLCVNDGTGKLRFGHITIDTDPSDEEEEDENY